MIHQFQETHILQSLNNIEGHQVMILLLRETHILRSLNNFFQQSPTEEFNVFHVKSSITHNRHDAISIMERKLNK